MNVAFPRLVLFCIVLLACAAARGEELRGLVVSVADGDTVTVLDAEHRQHRVRLAGIDAPEKRQAFGTRSRESLAALVFKKTVFVEWHKADRYGRLVGKVVVSGVDAGYEQIATGHAWHYKQYAREQSAADRLTYAQAEDAARAGRVGLWSDASAVPPWEYRHSRQHREVQ